MKSSKHFWFFFLPMFFIIFSNELFAQNTETETFEEVNSPIETDEDCKQWEGPCTTINTIWRNAPVGIGGYSTFNDFTLRVITLSGYLAGIYAQGPIALHARATGSTSAYGNSYAGFFEGNVNIDGNTNVQGCLYTHMPDGSTAFKVNGKSHMTGETTIDGSLNVQNVGATAANIIGDVFIQGDADISGTLEVASLHALENIYAKEVHVKFPPFPDYVFEEDYDLMTLEDLNSYIQENKRLPGMPSAKEVAENGAELGDLQVKLTEKIEELTLYILEMNERLEKLEIENEQLKTSVAEKE